MYPSINMTAFAYPERDVVQAVFQRHNDWIHDYSSHAPQRLVGIACLPLPDVDAAIQELQRVARRGLLGVLTRHFIGVDNLIWGNDYPHHDSIWPHSQEVIARIFAGVPEAEKAPMTFGNVTQLYGLTPPAVAAA